MVGLFVPLYASFWNWYEPKPWHWSRPYTPDTGCYTNVKEKTVDTLNALKPMSLREQLLQDARQALDNECFLDVIEYMVLVLREDGGADEALRALSSGENGSEQSPTI